MVKNQSIYLRQLLDAIYKIELFVGDMNSDQFLADDKTIHACLMVLIHIGEICASMKRYGILLPNSDALKIIAMRNFLAHQYLDIRPKLIAQTIFSHIPSLKIAVSELLMQQIV